MADESSGQEKTEQPTPRRISEARKKGDVAKSMEVPSAAVLLTSLLTLYLSGEYILKQSMNLVSHYLKNTGQISVNPADIAFLTREGMTMAATITLPLMTVIVLTGLLANFAQIGALYAPDKIAPKLSKINPIQGFSNLFSKQTLAQTIKSTLKVLVITLVAYHEINKVLPGILPLMDQPPYPILAFMARTAFWIFFKSALVIAVLAAADYTFQRWQFTEKMKMTKQEVKEEAKQTEGDPYVKGRIRSIQMEMARRRMMAEVPKADVVITNPTHLAVALRYDSSKMNAPLVTAKGAGLIAQRIKEIALENSIPLMEDKPLARALYQEVDLNKSIPVNLFQAVAEVLAYVYSLKKKTA
ncbi:MAG: flagellar biosynthesis protein FlhB [Proteobacteria bacterium]|nr:flagellar biosynthesis protein FlhB [Pseudomonadota bacterium]MBU1685959.1 flagellar biosynthesis protein FlhB [Pseudomonadota bacterium]